MGDEADPESQAQELFEDFVQATTCRTTLRAFNQLCEHLQLAQPPTERPLYHTIKERLNYWKANGLWAKLDKRAAHQEYMTGRACAHTTCVIIGAGPCGLRTAVELGFMGARVVLLEKRDAFSRNNVLHLWPFTIHDLRGLGAKKFYGKFCAGSIDHISIRQLQLVLLKVALLLGVEVHVNVEFKELVGPPEDQKPENQKIGWRMEVHPKAHPVNQLDFDVIIGADGRRNTLPGFRRKEFRGKLAIAITANFKNRNTTAEAKVEEISGVAFIFNQRFFQELRQETGIDLENIVYYKDDTHYFVMTAKKQSLLEKGVILQDHADTELLLSRGNVDQNALQTYAREAADFSTGHQLPSLDFAMNHYGQPDVAMFDFTCMYASENAALVRQRQGHQLLVTLVGDSLLEPFWPMGTGIARGFLAALDSAWMIRSWAQGNAPLDVLAERESLYRLLPQTTPENINKNICLYTVDPATRYPNINPLLITPAQVRHLVDTGEETGLDMDLEFLVRSASPRLHRQESFSRSNKLLNWCQEQTQGYRDVAVNDLTTSWKSGLALCALIHHYRPDLIDFDSLVEAEVEENTRLGFDVAEREFGISPLMTVEEMSSVGEPDTLSMVMYLSQFYQLLKDTLPSSESLSQSPDLRAALIAPASLLSRLGHSPSRKRIPKEQKDALGKRRKTNQPCQDEQEQVAADGNQDNQVFEEGFVGGSSRSRVRLMATQFQAKMDESASSGQSPSSSAAAALRRQKYVQMYTGGVSILAEQIVSQLQSQEEAKPAPDKKELALRSMFAGSVGASDVCFFCSKRVYVMERLSAEGLFFHRSCFQCDYCSATLRLASYAYDGANGRFYCQQHYDLRTSGPAQRKRPAPSISSDRTVSHRTSVGSLASVPTASSTDSLVPGSGPPSADRRSSVASLIEREAGLAKRGRRGTPERIELENYRLRAGKAETQLTEEPEEVPEETLANYNLSLLEKSADASSSESEMDVEKDGRRPVISERAKASWRQAMELHTRLRREEEEDGEEDEEEEEEEDVYEDEEEDGNDLESSDEGEYSPWEMERHSGLWLLLEEETEEEFPRAPLTTKKDSSARRGDFTHSSHTNTHAPEEAQEPDSTTPDAVAPGSRGSAPDITRSTPSTQSTPPASSAPRAAAPSPVSSFPFAPTSTAPPPDDSSAFASFASSSSSSSSPKSSTTSGRLTGLGEGEKEKEEKERSPTTSDSAVVVTAPGTPPATQLKTGRESAGSVVTLEAVTLQNYLPRPAPAPVVPAVVLRGGGGQARGSFAESPCSDDAGEAFEDVDPASSSQRPLQQLVQERSARVEREKERKREMERRREIERAALMEAWDDPRAPLTTEPPPGRSRGALTLDPRRLTESLPPRLLTPLQGGSLFQQLKGLRDSQTPSQAEGERGTGGRALWRAVFSGSKKDRKKRGGTFPPGTVIDTIPSEKERKTANKLRRATDTQFRGSLGWTDESELACSTVLLRCSPNPGTNRRVVIDSKQSDGDSSCPTEVVGVLVNVKEPSSLSLTEAMFQQDREAEAEDLDARITRRVQRAARKQAKQEQLKRLHKAQIIQRQLEQVEEKQRQLEERGVVVEKALRGEADYWGDSNDNEEMDLHLGGMGKLDNPALMQQWFQLVQQKNTLMRYESELMIFARELELEDRQSRLQQELRERMAVDDHLKGEAKLAEERLILEEMLEVVEQRDALVSLLEEQRLQESQEDRDLEAVMLSRGLGLHWA
ncbi:protein-methionine sulfoxide oxidase mical3b [Polymixia lowei]